MSQALRMPWAAIFIMTSPWGLSISVIFPYANQLLQQFILTQSASLTMWLPSPVYDTFQQCVPSWTTVLLRLFQKRLAKSWSKKGSDLTISGPTRTGSGSGTVQPVELDHQGHGSTVEQLQGENPIKKHRKSQRSQLCSTCFSPTFSSAEKSDFVGWCW